jgi:hypothetical protein
MTEQQIITARLAELKRMLAELQASIRRLEIQKALIGFNREKEGALQ